jgi:hypothetical protein
MTKEKAIQIMNEFLEANYNVDPMYSGKRKTHQIFIEENEFYWRLVSSEESDINKTEGNIGGVGGGSFFLDKENGNIYEIGSPIFNWEEEFIKFKKGKKSEIDWKPKKNTYLNCKVETLPKIKFEEVKIRCKVSEKEKATKEFFQEKYLKQENQINPKLINRAFDLEEGELIVGINGKPQKEKINIVQKDFIGGLKNYQSALWDLKKWARVNNKKGVDNYWIEIMERDFEKPFSNWNLKLNMEFK